MEKKKIHNLSKLLSHLSVSISCNLTWKTLGTKDRSQKFKILECVNHTSVTFINFTIFYWSFTCSIVNLSILRYFARRLKIYAYTCRIFDWSRWISDLAVITFERNFKLYYNNTVIFQPGLCHCSFSLDRNSSMQPVLLKNSTFISQLMYITWGTSDLVKSRSCQHDWNISPWKWTTFLYGWPRYSDMSEKWRAPINCPHSRSTSFRCGLHVSAEKISELMWWQKNQIQYFQRWSQSDPKTKWMDSKSHKVLSRLFVWNFVC